MNQVGPKPIGIAFNTCRCQDGRIFANVQPAGALPLWEAVPCPVCRPQASPVTPEGKVKGAEDRRAAARARMAGA